MKRVCVLLLLCVSFLGLQAQDSLIGVGDLVHVTMKEDLEVKFEGEVSTNGFVILPYLGVVKIQNLTEKRAEKKIKSELEKELYQKATISVVVVKKAIGYVYVYGAVEKPGKVEIPPEGKISITQALAEVKGLSKWANPKLAYALKKNQLTQKYTKIKIDLEKAYNQLSGSSNINLQNNGIIVIPSLAEGAVVPGATQIMVAGKVKEPGIVLFEPGELATAVRAILKAGNFNKFADKSKVRIIRPENGKSRSINVDIKELLDKGELTRDIKLFSGDLVIVDDSWY